MLLFELYKRASSSTEQLISIELYTWTSCFSRAQKLYHVILYYASALIPRLSNFGTRTSTQEWVRLERGVRCIGYCSGSVGRLDMCRQRQGLCVVYVVNQCRSAARFYDKGILRERAITICECQKKFHAISILSYT